MYVCPHLERCKRRDELLLCLLGGSHLPCAPVRLSSLFVLMVSLIPTAPKLAMMCCIWALQTLCGDACELLLCLLGSSAYIVHSFVVLCGDRWF
jgi:hypothetical protein